jgi:endonuclease-8
MPEGPSIVIMREELGRFRKKKVLGTSGNAKIDLSLIQGQTIQDIRSWGKHLLIIFKKHYLRIHLLMFGKYLINERRETEPRLRLIFSKDELNFHACSVKLLPLAELEQYDWTRDAMSDEWDPLQAVKTVRKQKDAMICDVLMEQEYFSGVGNIIKNEVLFICKVHPETLCADIDLKKTREIVRVTREYCFDFLRWKRKFELRKHWQVYKKVKCPDCGNKLEKRPTGLKVRRSFICTNCQPL